MKNLFTSSLLSKLNAAQFVNGLYVGFRLARTEVFVQALVREMRELLAYKLYSEGRLSGGTAAKLAGMPRVQFLLKAGQQNIEWLSYGKDEVRRELS